VYSVTYATGQALFVGLLVLTGAFASELGVTAALTLRLATLLAAGILFALWIRPVMRSALTQARLLIQGARDYGFSVYVGRVLSIGTYNMDVLVLAAFTSAQTVALYVLARSLATIVGFPALGMASALFPQMARERGIHRSWLTVCWAASLGCAALLVLLGPALIDGLFSSGFQQASDYLLPLALAEAIRGVTSLYNSYLSAQGLGRDLQRAGIVLALTNVITTFALIPPFGATGAAWSCVIALVANLIAHVLGYRRSLREPVVLVAP
jgi:O-antigen/teichoic acid export membrane protein